MRVNLEYIDVLVVASVGLAVRGIISLGSYSGKSSSPMFGDYEAQRHWQEVTYNLPVQEWYTNTTNNDLLYWGLDYPPLTAYHSYVLGQIAHEINGSYVELSKSRGYESNNHKTFMRLTVLVADLCVYIPACILFALTLRKFVCYESCLNVLILLILYPGLILIDNGHFQYNNISLGLMLMAVAAVLRESNIWAAVLYSLALNYKQMELYHALPFFVYLLRVSFNEKTITNRCVKFLQIAFITLATFVVLWLPWIASLESFLTTLGRLFPFNRGVFEDKVANIWCSLNVLYKFKENVTNSSMAVVCLATTLMAALPINFYMFKSNCPKRNFLFSLFNSAIAFFLFSFQVHEKSILLAAIPMVCLLPYMPTYAICFLKITILSMLPLLNKDQLLVEYFCMTLAFSLIIKYILRIKYTVNIKLHFEATAFIDVLDVCILIISLATVYIPSPTRLPHIWPLLISVFCCGSFSAILLLCILYQFNYENYCLAYKKLRLKSNKDDKES